jgi:hypothetical protein
MRRKFETLDFFWIYSKLSLRGEDAVKLAENSILFREDVRLK